MIPIAALGKLVGAHPLDAALILGIVATGGMLAWHLAVTDPVLKLRLSKAEKDLYSVQLEHTRQVAAARFAETQASESYRRLEQDNGKTIASLQSKVATLELKNAKLALDLSESADSVRDATARYLAAQAAAAARDPASAGRIAGETGTLLGQLHAETDRLAEESAKAADACAGRLGLLQDYVRDVCLRRPE